MAWPNLGVAHRPIAMGTRGAVASAHPLASLAVQEAMSKKAAGIIINPAGYTTTSIATQVAHVKTFADHDDAAAVSSQLVVDVVGQLFQRGSSSPMNW